MPTIRRIVPNLPLADRDTTATSGFYRDVLGMAVDLDQGWIVHLRAPEIPAVQLQLVARDASAPVDAAVSIEVDGVDEVDAVHDAAIARGLEVVHPRTDEPWGVYRFFVRDPSGTVVNVLAHR